MKSVSMYTHDNNQSCDVLVLEHAPLVKKIACHLMHRLPGNIQLDDLIQAGMIGLIEAARHYDISQGARFETYAGIRIRGSILDEVRRSDWTPRSVHKKARMVAEAIREIEHSTGRDARDIEVAEALSIDLTDYHQILRDSLGCKIFSIEELRQSGENFLDEFSDGEQAPDDRLTQYGFKAALADAIAGLPERERLVTSLYYEEELNLREIGDVLAVSESRVCQIHSQAMLRLRARMIDWLDEAESRG